MTVRSTTADLANALPGRPVAVRPPQTVGPLAALGLFAMLFGLMALVLWWLGPDLMRDWRNDWVPAADVRIEEGRCRSRLFVLRVCDVTLVDERSTATAKRTLWYAFIDASGGAERIAPLRSPADPALLSTDLGLERLIARSLTLALALAVLAFCVGVGVRVIQQGVRAANAFRSLSGQRLVPVVVEIERHNLVPPRRRLWVYLYDDGGTRGRAFIELPSRDRPFFTDASEKWALALRGTAGGAPLLLDAQLACLDLTGPEKAAFYAACRSAFGGENDGDAVA
jgi:hypothetical protein